MNVLQIGNAPTYIYIYNECVDVIGQSSKETKPRASICKYSAIYQILLGWKTYNYYHETDELPNPRPTQPKKK